MTSTSRVLWLFLIAFAVGNVLLLAQNLQLRNQQRLLTSRTTLVGPKLGDDVSILADRSAQQRGATQPVRAERTVFIFLSPSCAFCRELSPVLADTFSRLDASMVAAFGVARQTENREAVNQYLAEYGLRLPMLYVADSVLQELGLIATPTTFIVNRDGVVTEVWTGLWSNDDKIAVHDSLAIVQ